MSRAYENDASMLAFCVVRPTAWVHAQKQTQTESLGAIALRSGGESNSSCEEQAQCRVGMEFLEFDLEPLFGQVPAERVAVESVNSGHWSDRRALWYPNFWSI